MRSKLKLIQHAQRRSFYKSWKSEHIPVSGSNVRDHLANERTFLAWARTSLVFVGSGIGLHQFYQYAFAQGFSEDDSQYRDDIRQLRMNVTTASGSLVLIGFGTLSYAAMRYFSVFRALKGNKFIPNTFGVSIFTICATSMSVIGFITTLQFPQFIFHDNKKTTE